MSDILEIGRTDDVHQSMIVSLLRVALRPIYDIFALTGSSCDPMKTLSDESRRKSSPPPSCALDGSPPPVDCSRVGFISCYFYLYIILREDAVDSFVLNWFLEQLLADVCRTESLMQKGLYSQTLWFWTVMFGACATVAAKVTSYLECEQMRTIRDVYMDKINLASQLLRIKSWEGAKSTMRLFAWEDDFDGEEELKSLWEEAVWADDGHRPKLHSIGPGFPRA